MSMTPRQLSGLLQVVGHENLMEFYHSSLSYRMAGSDKFPSLNEFLESTSSKSTEPVAQFDEKTDKFLEERALRAFNERAKK